MLRWLLCEAAKNSARHVIRLDYYSQVKDRYTSNRVPVCRRPAGSSGMPHNAHGAGRRRVHVVARTRHIPGGPLKPPRQERGPAARTLTETGKQPRQLHEGLVRTRNHRQRGGGAHADGPMR